MKKTIFLLLILVLLTGCYRNIPKVPPPLGSVITTDINLTENLYYNLKNEIPVNPTAVRVSPVNPPQGQVINNVVFVYSFDRNNLESLYASWHTLPRHKTGNNISYDLYFYWAPNDNGVGFVTWCVQPLQMTPDSGDTLMDTLSPPICVNATAPGTAYKLVSAVIPNVTIPYVLPNDEFIYSIYRNAPADNYNADAHLLEFNVKYYESQLGEKP